MAVEINIKSAGAVEASVGARDATPAKWLGEWQEEQLYFALSKVSRNGSSYVCVEACTGVDPETDTEGRYWLLIAQKGENGKGIRSIDEVDGGTLVDGDRVTSRWTDYRITYDDGSTQDYRVYGGADGKHGEPGAGITNITFGRTTEEGNLYYIRVGQNLYPFTAPFGPAGIPGADGPAGPPGVSGVYVGSGDMPAEYNVQVDPNGEALEIPPQPKLMLAADYDAVTDWNAVLGEGEIAWRCE